MIRRLPLLIGCLAMLDAQAMQPLNESQMREVSGAGVGFYVDNLMHDQNEAVTEITGMTDSRDKPVTVKISNTYIKGMNSNRGELNTKANIGDIDHPFTLTVGQPNNNASTPPRQTVLKVTSPHWSDPSNNSKLFGIWAYYQGCLYGETGCYDPTIAVNNIDNEIARQHQERDRLNDRYASIGYFGLKIGIDVDMTTVRYRQSTLVSRTDAARSAYSEMEQAYLALGNNTVKLGEYVSCIFCSTEARVYNQSINRYEQRVTEMTEAQKSLSVAWNTERNGYTLTQRVQDYEAYVSLCGTPDTANGCNGGRIESLVNDRKVIQIVADAMRDEANQNKNLDIGMETQISAPTVLYTDRGQVIGEINSTTPLTLALERVTFDNSYINLWSEDNKLKAEAGLQLYMDKMIIGGCNNCTDDARAVMKNVYVDLNLGHGVYQPLTIETTNENNLQMSLPSVTWENHQAFYENVPKSNIAIGNMTMSGKDLGSQVLRGIRIDYMNARTHNLPR